MNFFRLFALLILPLLLSACGNGTWNDPYPVAESGGNILYSSFEERPKHLDPARSYSSNEAEFTAQIYEPPLQYHYLKRPYTLIPLTAARMPTVTYYDAAGGPLSASAPVSAIAESVYEIHIRPGIYYQPHPAFARDAQGKLRYQDMKPGDWHGIQTLSDFRHTGTRELVAGDYVYEIKRLAAPQLNSPILGVMAEYIIGLKDYAARLEKAARSLPRGAYPDLQRYPLAGAEVVDRYTYRIKLRGKYPQFLYWLAMPFFARDFLNV